MAAAKLGVKRGPMSEEVRAKISAARMGHVVSEETRNKIAEKARGRKMPQRALRKRIKLRGVPKPVAFRIAMSKARKGMTPPRSTIEASAVARRGKPLAPEVKAKMAQSQARRRLRESGRVFGRAFMLPEQRFAPQIVRGKSWSGSPE